MDSVTPDNPAPIPWSLLDRYFAGEATQAEAERVQFYLKQHPEIERGVRDPMLYVRGGGASVSPSTPSWETMAARIARDGNAPHREILPSVPSRVRPFARLTKSLSFGIAIVAAAFLVFVVGTKRKPEVTRTYQTTSGQRSIIPLANGSTMILAPASSATVSSTGVDITGEAQFSVLAKSSRPFIVRTRNAVVRVLGTTFVVRQYAEERSTLVVVDDGKVNVRSRKADATGNGAVLAPRMLARVADSGVVVSSGVTTRDYTAWTSGVLVFNRIPLRDVIAELSRTYGADIRIADSTLSAEPVIAEFDVVHKPLVQVLDVLCEAMNAHYVRDHGAFVLVRGFGASGVRREQQLPRYRFPQLEKQYGR